MKLFFDNVDFKSSSGPNTFARRIAESLYSLGHVITNDPNSDIHIAFIEQICEKQPKSKLVQRLDGIWFKPDEFIPKNRGIKATYDNAAHVIWQTNFDKSMVTHHWGDRPGSVLHNGIKIQNVNVTHPDLHILKKRYDKIFVSSANWHRQKRLKENIELFNILSEHEKSCLIVLGSNPDHVVRQDNIIYTGSLSHDILMQVYAVSNWMIHLAWLDHCPNTVVEAISQKVPVICSDSGGTQEIVKSFGIVIPEKEKYQNQLIDHTKPPEIELKIGPLPEISVDPSHVNIDDVSLRYEKFFKDVLGEKK